jgi:serpin B
LKIKVSTIVFSFLIFLSVLSKGQVIKETVTGNNSFAFELFKNVFKEDSNTFISPYSISSALAMTYGGARNETERQMSKVLHYDLNQINTHQGFFELNAMLGKISGDSAIKFSIANALWKLDHFSIKKDYLDLTKKYYDASIYPLNGAKPINDWADKNTFGKIKEIVKDEDLQDALLVLTNAIYFKGDWVSTFDAKNTRKEIFNTSKELSDRVNMMYQTQVENYFEDEQNQILELPYKGEAISMLIILPKENSSIKKLVSAMDWKQFSYYKSELKKQEVNIRLPKFSFDSEYHLEDVLPKMGMPDAFYDSADFSGMSKGLFIKEVIHKAIIEVNENGSEAAAVTTVIMTKESLSREITFKANRPFLFFICDKATDSILFMGSVMNPNEQNN